ncbi:MAG: TAT-variant-translocated molybdopterin oxidoreductase [Thermoanaerobaculia bacterium]
MTEKSYWKSLAERDDRGELEASEFAEPLEPAGAGTDRRTFLRAAGFTIGAAALAGCRQSSVEKAIPYLLTPEGIVPGRAYWMASTCAGCEAACGVLVKCRDGRPIKLEGNPGHPVSRGGLCAVGQASVLEPYDSMRLKAPRGGGRESTWEKVDREIGMKLNEIRDGKGRVRILTTTRSGRATRGVIERFLAGFANGELVVYDPVSCSAILAAHEITHGRRLLPRYRFDRADTVVGLDADFLGTWISPVEYTNAYTSRRRLAGTDGTMSWHAQFEARMTITGGKADNRFVTHPDDVPLVLEGIAERLGLREPSRRRPPVRIRQADIDLVASKLDSARGRALLVCGTNDLTAQLLANEINHHLGSYGATIDISRPSRQKEGSEEGLERLVGEIREGSVDALFVAGCNPAYDLPGSARLSADLRTIPLLVSLSSHIDETAGLAQYVCPEPHFLETWSDHEPVSGVLAVGQPAISPLGSTRSAIESFAVWSGDPRNGLEIIRDELAVAMGTDPAGAWHETLAAGYREADPAETATTWRGAGSLARRPDDPAETSLSLVVYPSVGMLDGRHAHNPWLHELPDPVTKVTWGNCASFSPATAARLGIEEGRVVTISAGEAAAELPAHIQPGQHDGVVAVAAGYGRLGTERFALTGPEWLFRRRLQPDGSPVGVRMGEFQVSNAGSANWVAGGIRVSKTGRMEPIAMTQSHHSLSVPAHLDTTGGRRRPIIQETSFAAWKENPGAGEPESHHIDADLWAPHPYEGHRWGMAIDLSACTGCSGCVIACQAENNVPVVGKDEVLRQREMHWLRIDRYYAEGEDGGVDMVHQPMLCAHCENAPCESVCPVVATVHSEEGLNQQVYNRCVGTRYCANNCPYKTRRFNWFDYPREDRLQNLVLNPDVAVRSRGVMEKCSMCVQRIELGKMEAKRIGANVADGEIATACEQSCPARAIVFGDLNDPGSRVAKAAADPRYYVVLGELNVRPAVGYLRVVRNRKEDEHQEETHV